MGQGLKEHMTIIEAVTSGDPEIAERTMREHLLSVIGALHQLAEMGVVPYLAPVAARS
jgi:DNA-binding GntR family transcriptional regulator